MSISDGSRERYSATTQVATYLEAEWSDFLFGGSPTSSSSTTDPMTDRVRPDFYVQIGKLAFEWVTNNQLVPARYCDVGGSTGRTLFEVSNRVPSLTELVLVEPAAALCDWAKKILLGPLDLGWIPIVEDWHKPSFGLPARRPGLISQDKLCIYELPAEDTPRPAGYFELITCLNVLDRHKHPARLVETLASLLAPRGLLILASPLEFEEKFTPERDRWIQDLNVLFSDSLWVSIAETNLLYEFRGSRRKWSRYSSQIVAKQKR